MAATATRSTGRSSTPATAACRPGASGWTTPPSRCWRSTSTRWAAGARRREHAMDAQTRTDADPPPLYATRLKVYPRAVTGLWRRVKWLALVVLLGIYYLVPWLR